MDQKPSVAPTSVAPILVSNVRESLRRQVVGAGLDLIRDAGEEALTMRRIAARCGVKPSVLYSVNLNKPAILRELANDGSRRLSLWLDQHQEVSLVSLCRHYLEFARRWPHLYRLMSQYTRSDDLAPGAEAFTSRATAIVAREGGCVTEPRTQALQLWLATHAAALLVVTREGTSTTPYHGRPFVDTFLESVVDGILHAGR